MDSEEENCPHIQSHIEVSKYSRSSRIPYHQNEELVALVHEYYWRKDEIINLMQVKGIKDIGLVREHLLNESPALAEGIL
jgi:hypothetical protein